MISVIYLIGINCLQIDNLRSELLACAEERDRYHDEVVTLRVSAGFIQEAAQTIQVHHINHFQLFLLHFI